MSEEQSAAGPFRRAFGAGMRAWTQHLEHRQDSPNVIVKTARSGTQVVMLDGEIHARSAYEVVDRIRAALRPHDAALVLDLRGTRSLDSSVLAALITGLREAQTSGSAFAVVRPVPSVWRVFELTGLSGEFPSFDSLRAALASIPGTSDVVAHALNGEGAGGGLTPRQERALAALYWMGAFDAGRGQPVNALVKSGYLGDSRYAGPLTALADQGLVENRQGLLSRNWNGTRTWWLTEKGRQAAREFL